MLDSWSVRVGSPEVWRTVDWKQLTGHSTMGGVDKQIEMVGKVEHNIGGIATSGWVFGCSWTCVPDAIRLHVSWNKMSSANESSAQIVKSKCSKWPFSTSWKIFLDLSLFFLFIKSPPSPPQKAWKKWRPNGSLTSGFTRIPWWKPPNFCWRQSYGSSSHLIPCLATGGLGLDPVMLVTLRYGSTTGRL